MNENIPTTGKLPKLVEKDPIGGSIISKLNASRSLKAPDPRQSNISAIALSTNDKIRNNDSIVQLFPDIELCIQILTSSIISPNDMTVSKLNYISPNIKLPGDVKQTLLNTIEEHIEKYYELNSKLSLILRESLFTKGSYIEAIIPEASLDDVISQYGYKGNVALESIEKLLPPTYNFLGSDHNTHYNISNEELVTIYANNKVVSTTSNVINKNNTKLIEVTQEDLNIQITDNFKLLNLSALMVENNKRIAKNKLYPKSLTVEEAEDNVQLNKFFREVNNYKQLDVVQFKTMDAASRKSFGRPLVFKLPVESVIPVHVVNNPSSHLGYFVLLDQNGTPIQIDQSVLGGELDQQRIFTTENEQKLNLVNKAAAGLLGMTKPDIVLDNLEEIYSKLVENMLKDKLKKGLYGDLVDIKDNADVYRVMLFRALRSQMTKILFLPADLVSFYAFDYRDNGTGKSLMEKAATLYSIRSIVLFSRLMAYIKNSTTVTNITAVIDEHERDVDGAIDKIMSEALKTRQTALPLGITRIDDLVDWVHKVGMSFKFQHPGLPNYEITREDLSTSKIVPDDELDRMIQEYIIMSFGLTPEIVQAGYSTDYATTVVAKNLLLAKRVTQTQNVFIPQVNNHIRKIIINDMTLQNDMRDIIKNNIQAIKKTIKKAKKDDTNDMAKLDKISDKNLIGYIIDVYINEVEVGLPKPETYEANNIKNAFQDYKSVLDDSMDMILSTEALPEELVGTISNKIDTIKGVMKSALLKKWLTDNNYLPELSDFITRDDEDKPVFNILTEHETFLNALTEALLPFLKSRTKDKAKFDAKLQKIEDAANDTGGSDDYGSDDSSGDDYGSDDSEGGEETDDMGGDEDGMDDDMGDEGADSGEGDDDLGGDMGDDVGDEGGDDDFGDDFGGDDMGMGDDDKSSSSGPKETEADKQLKQAKVETEKAKADKAKADAELQRIKAQKLQEEEDNASSDNNTGENDEQMRDTLDDSNDATSNPDNNTTDESQDGGTGDETQEQEQTNPEDMEADQNTDDEEKPEGEEVIKQIPNVNKHPHSLRKKFHTSTFIYD